MQQKEPLPTSAGRIIIVDDETELTAALVEMLAQQGFETRGFTDGREALVVLADETFDVLLVDLMMPAMDGITLLKKAIELDPDLVGIIMTGQGTVQTAVEAMKSGAFDYLLKPFKLSEVLTSLSRSLEIHRLRTENVQLRELLGIYELGQAVAYTHDLQEICSKTSNAAIHLSQADEISILLPTAEGDSLQFASADGNGHKLLIGSTVPLEGTIAGWVAGKRETLVLEGEVHDHRFAPSHPRRDIRTAISMPMVSGNDLAGVINLNITRRRRPVAPGQIRALNILAGIAAAAIQNARLQVQTEQRLNRLMALRMIDLAITSSLDLRVMLNVVLDQVTSQLKTDAAAVLLADPHSDVMEFTAGRGFSGNAIKTYRVTPGSGYAGRAALERHTVVAADLSQGDLDPHLQQLHDTEGIRSCVVTPLIEKGRVDGVLAAYHRFPFEPDAEWLEFFEALAGQAAIAIDNARLFDGLQRSNQQLVHAYNATIEGWSRALDLRDHETEGHTQRVTEMTLRLANALGGFDEQELVNIRRGALLHDIGKMGVPDSILLKPGKLTKKEQDLMRKHPEYAYQLLSPVAYLHKALEIPYCHHELWDGSGYPRGLKGQEIPRAARIFTVVDIWDALRSDRPYRASMPEDEVIAYLRTESRTHLDPEVVDAFVKLLQMERSS